MNVFVTGATGYIGGAIVDALIEAGHGVVGLAHSETSEHKLAQKGVLIVRGEVQDVETLSKAASNADAVIHAASTNGSDMGQVDRQAVQTIVTALKGTQKPFVYTSGSWVLGNTGEQPVDESAHVAPVGIVAWRPAVEQMVLNAAADGVKSIVIRPGLVYGRAGGIPAQLVFLAKRSGGARFIGSGENAWSVIHVNDLAQAYVRALTLAPAGTLLNVTAEPAVLFKEIAQAAGKAVQLTGDAQSSPIDQARSVLGPVVDALVLHQRIRSDAARVLLHWSPQYPSIVQELAEGSYLALR